MSSQDKPWPDYKREDLRYPGGKRSLLDIVDKRYSSDCIVTHAWKGDVLRLHFNKQYGERQGCAIAERFFLEKGLEPDQYFISRRKNSGFFVSYDGRSIRNPLVVEFFDDEILVYLKLTL